jgi:hypothetical protein
LRGQLATAQIALTSAKKKGVQAQRQAISNSAKLVKSDIAVENVMKQCKEYILSRIEITNQASKAHLAAEIVKLQNTIVELKGEKKELKDEVKYLEQQQAPGLQDKKPKKRKKKEPLSADFETFFGEANKKKRKKQKVLSEYDSDDDDAAAALRENWGKQGKEYPSEMYELGMTVIGQTMQTSVVSEVVEACFSTCAVLVGQPILAELPIPQVSTFQKIRTAMGWVATICGISKAVLQSSITMHMDLSSGSKNETLGSCILSFFGLGGSEGVTIGGAWEQSSKSADASADDVITQVEQALAWLNELISKMSKSGLEDPLIPSANLATLKKVGGSLVAMMGDHAFGQDKTARDVMSKLGMEVVETVVMVHCWNHKIYNFQVLALEGEQKKVLSLTTVEAKKKVVEDEATKVYELSENEEAALLDEQEIETQIKQLQALLSTTSQTNQADKQQQIEDLEVQVQVLQSRRKASNVVSRFMYELAKVFSHLENISVWCYGKRFEDWLQLDSQKVKYGDIWVPLKRHVGNRHHILYENAVFIYMLWECYIDFIASQVPTPHNKLLASLQAALYDPVIKAAIRVRAVLFYDLWWPLRLLVNYDELGLYILDGQQISEILEAEVDKGCAGTSAVGTGAEVNLFGHCITSMKPSTGTWSNEQKQAGYDEKLRLLKTEKQKRTFDRVFHTSYETHVLPQDDLAEEIFFKEILQAHFLGITENDKKRFNNFIKEYRPGGVLQNLTAKQTAELSKVLMTNDLDETLFGLQAMIKKYLSNAASWNVNALVMWRYNRVTDWLAQLNSEVRSELVMYGVKKVPRLISDFKKKAKATAAEKSRLGKVVKEEEEKKWRTKLLKFLKTLFYITLLPSSTHLTKVLENASGEPLSESAQLDILKKQCRYLKLREVETPAFTKAKVSVVAAEQAKLVGSLLDKVAAKVITLAPPDFKYGNERFQCFGDVHPALPSVLLVEKETKATQEAMKNQILADLKEARDLDDAQSAEKKAEKEKKRTEKRAGEVAAVQARIDEGKGTSLTFWCRCGCGKWRVISQNRSTKLSNNKTIEFACQDVCQDKCSTPCDACEFVPATCNCKKKPKAAPAKKQTTKAAVSKKQTDKQTKKKNKSKKVPKDKKTKFPDKKLTDVKSAATTSVKKAKPGAVEADRTTSNTRKHTRSSGSSSEPEDPPTSQSEDGRRESRSSTNKQAESAQALSKNPAPVSEDTEEEVEDEDDATSLYRPGYWLTTTDLSYIAGALLGRDQRFPANAYDKIVEGLVDATKSRRPDSRVGQWVTQVANCQDHTLSGNHWVLVSVKFVVPPEAILWEPMSNTSCSDPVIKALKGVCGPGNVKVLITGQETDGWSCGYISIWWNLLMFFHGELYPDKRPITAIPEAPPEGWSELVWLLLELRDKSKKSTRINAVHTGLSPYLLQAMNDHTFDFVAESTKHLLALSLDL